MAKQSQPKFSDKTHLRLVEVKADSFAAFNHEQPYVVIIPEDKNVMVLRGDQGVGKTSALQLIRTIFSGELPENAINSIDHNIDVNAVLLDKEGIEYQIRITKGSYRIVTVKNKGQANEERSNKLSPKDWLRRNIGEVGEDPSTLRKMKPDDQVKFIRDMVVLEEQYAEAEAKLIEKTKITTNNRSEHNRQKRSLKQVLLNSGFFKLKKDSRVEMVPTEDFEALKKDYSEDSGEKLQAAIKKQDELEEQNEKRRNLVQDVAKSDTDLATINKSVIDLEEQLRKAKEKQVEVQGNNTKLKEELAACPDVFDEIVEVKKDIASINEYSTKRNEMLSAEGDLNAYNDACKKYDEAEATLEQLSKMKADFVKQITPDIEGLELFISSNIDVKEEIKQYKDEHPEASKDDIEKKTIELEAKNKEGIYVNGHTLQELSESELLAFCINVWRHKGVRALIIENLSSYGSDAINSINTFAKEGAQVFASLMERGTKSIEIGLYPDMSEIDKQ